MTSANKRHNLPYTPNPTPQTPMKIYSNAADNFLKELKVSTVLIYGNDTGGVSHMAKRIIKKFIGDEEEQETVKQLDSDELKDNENIILDEIASKGFFSSKKLVWVADPPEGAALALQEAFKSLDKSCFLLVTGGELKRESKIRKLYEDSKEHTALLCYKEEGVNLKRHIMDWLNKNSIRADQDAVEYLVANLGEDKLITENELEKILTFLGDDKRLSFDDASAILADNSELAVNDIMYAISCKTPKMLEKSLARAFADNIAGVVITRSMLYHFNRLLNAKLMIQNGMSADTVVESLRLFFKLKEPFKTSLRKWNVQQLEDAVKTAIALELDVKSNYAESEMMIRDKLLKLAV